MSAKAKRGRFISFEGGEGAGKSTQVARLASRLSDTGIEAITTREPGGSAGAEEIRALLVTGAVDRWSPLSEALLFYAARHDHLEHTIRPALKRGAWVLCDRFADSTRAYQGAAGGIDNDILDHLHRAVVGGDDPDLTFILDLPPEAGLARAHGRRDPQIETRFEAKDAGFHARLRACFLDIGKTDPARYRVIDATRRVDDVASEIWTAVTGRFPEVTEG
jgi:dTMP kinase